MNFRRVAVLLGKEVVRGPRNFMFIIAVVIPIVLTLTVNLMFGTFFSSRARLGIVDEGNSRLPGLAAAVDSIHLKEYGSTAQLREAVADGAVDVGMVLSPDFDESLVAQEHTALSVFTWGESQLKHRAVLGTTVIALVREIAGQEIPVDIQTTTLGEAVMPWEDRLLPFLVLMAVLIGGVMVSATSIVEERQNRTLKALIVTPATLGEVLAAKAILGVGLSSLMGALILMLNRAFGHEPLLLVIILVLGAIMAAAIGLLLGVLVKDINTLFATIKSMGIFLYAPALVYMFPEIPAWIGRVFPTYYLIQPVMEVAQEGAGWLAVLPDLAVLVVLIAVLLGVVSRVARRASQAE